MNANRPETEHERRLRNELNVARAENRHREADMAQLANEFAQLQTERDDLLAENHQMRALIVALHELLHLVHDRLDEAQQQLRG